MKTTHNPKRGGLWAYICLLGLLCSNTAFSQIPIVTVRYANPQYHCLSGQYCLDVEFKSNVEFQQVFGMNVRFFYPDTILELVGFSDYQGGYGPVAPDPPLVSNSIFAGPALFNFAGSADFVNGAIQLINPLAPAIILDTANWTKLFQVCFTIDDPDPDLASFCPSVVWDLQQDPSNGGFLIGDDGVVITLTDPMMMMESVPSDENVVQFNWVYIGTGTPPYGTPVESSCISIDCSPTIFCAVDTTVECDESTVPPNTGIATATDICEGDPTITFSDMTTTGNCPNNFVISRRWIATNACALADTCFQLITVIDTTAPLIACPNDFTVQCANQVPTPNPGSVGSTDNCSGLATVTFLSDVPSNQVCANRFTLTRTYRATDGCGNSSTCNQTITVFDNIPPSITCPSDATVQCATNVPAPNPGSVTTSDNCGGGATVTFAGDVSSNQNCPNCTTVTRTYLATDACGNTSTCNQLFTVIDFPTPIIDGEGFICSGDTAVYTVLNFNDSFMYNWNLSAGGTIIQNIGGSITVVWQVAPGGPFVISVTVTAGPGCQATGFFNVFTQNAGPLACFDHINLSIDNECGTIVTSGMILTGDVAGNNNYEVIIKDMDGNIIPNATFTWEDVGKTFKVAVVSRCSGQSCWGLVTVEDKLPPVINCICPVDNENENCNITCRQIQQIVDGNIPLELRPNVIDNCGGATLDIIDLNVDYGNCGGGSVDVTWKATDQSGNMSTCHQQYNIVPLTLETLVFPPDITGTCGGSLDPAVTGWPTVNGIPLNLPAGVCNLYVTYKDFVIQLCGNGRKIIRTWTVVDWCTGRTAVFGQSIIYADHEGPVLTCQENLEIGTDVWHCYANVVVPKPGATDACSKIVSYKLISLDGTGTIVTLGNNIIINGLPLGSHIVKWIVTDECQNISTCNVVITVVDDVPPVVSCQARTVISLTDERPHGVTLAPAKVFDDGSIDNCGPVTFRARRMTSCIDFDWTTGGACVDEIPGGGINGKDLGTDRGPCVPFSCCDVGAGPIMVELEVTDAAGNVNYCMVEIEVQDKLSPNLTCPPTILVSCEFPFIIEEGTFKDVDGNNDGSLDEDPLSAVFGNMFDAFRHQMSDRKNITILDPSNTQFAQPRTWGTDGWAIDNCEITLEVTVSEIDDCSGASFPFQGPPGSVKLIQRFFHASDGFNTSTCVQHIWVVDYHRFFITDTTCNNDNPNDGVIWPCDILLTTCPQELTGLNAPVILDDGCSLIGVNYKDTRYDFVDNACYKVLREWKVLDWCQYNPNTGYGLWSYTQTIRVMDVVVPQILTCPAGPLELCVSDPGIRIPANNQMFLGENNPNATHCSVHVSMSQRVHESCSDIINYDVKIYPFNGLSFIQIVPTTTVALDQNHEVIIGFNTEQSSIPSIQHNGLPYNSPLCGEYHRVLWSVEDGCGNRSYCDYLFRLEDCKKPIPVCIQGLSVAMGANGQVTVQAASFNASSVDDCTPSNQLLYSFSGTSYVPSFTYTCANVPVIGVPFNVSMWAADGGTDQNCNGSIEWSERNKDACVTTLLVTDPTHACGQVQGMLSGEILTDHHEAVEKVIVNLSSPQQLFPAYTTQGDGKFAFTTIPLGLDYMITPERNDDYKNGVSTLDLVKIQKHLLGVEIFDNPYQYIAADANNSHSITALDLLDLRKLILGLNDVLPNNDSWRFMDKNVEIPDPANPWLFNENLFVNHWDGQSTDNDFIAVKIGDVNNSVKANAFQVLPRDERRVMNIISHSKEVAKSGEIVELKLTFPEVVSGFQWTMETDGLEYVGVSSGDIQIDDSNVGILENGVTTMSWNGDVLRDGNSNQDMSIILRWKATSPGKISNRVRLTSLITSAEGYTPDGEILRIKLAPSEADISKEFTLYQNKPNPWNGQTTIGFDLPVAGHTRLIIFDVTGKMVTSMEGDFSAGYNTFVLTSKEIPTTGVMYYRLESGEFTASKKMVLIR